MAEGLKTRPELGSGSSHALGHGPHFPVPFGHQGDDPIRLPEPNGAKHHTLVTEEGHPELPETPPFG
jgi:hypothetical protein